LPIAVDEVGFDIPEVQKKIIICRLAFTALPLLVGRQGRHTTFEPGSKNKTCASKPLGMAVNVSGWMYLK